MSRSGSKADVDAAVAAASAALKKWQALSCNERARHLYAIARHVQKHARFLAVLETLDNGKTIRETRDIDIPLVARHFYHHAGWAELRDDAFPGYEAAGVCGQIIPWNFPLLMLAWKVAPALAAGCTVVLKSAEHTPLTAIAFAEICAEAGLPAGVFNLVNGDGSTGAALAAHDGVAKLAFTGSTEVGRVLRRQTAGSGKKLSLELGGKSPFIVFDNADLDAAVEGVVDAIWFNQGEVCCAGSRAIVQEGIAERFHDRLRARMEKLRVGDPLDKAMDMGAVVAPVQIEQITARVRAGVAEGGKMWQPSWAESFATGDGCFFPPTLFTHVSPASTLAQEEVFGPVLASMTFRTPGEAVEIANNSRYGLAASIWSQNLDEAFDTARKVKSGVVWINATNLFDAMAGFGGYKESGYGREGGREGMLEYLGARMARQSQILACCGADRRAAACTRRNALGDRPHGQDVCRRQAGAARFGIFLSGLRQGRKTSGRSRPRQPQGHSQCRRGGAQGRRLERHDRPRPCPGALFPRREPGTARRRVCCPPD